MKTRISAGLVALAVLVMAFAGVAGAATDHTSKGKLTRFSYNASSKVGKLVVTAKKKTTFRVPATADCGLDMGQSGDQIPCKSLGKAKYHNRPVRVTWTKSNGVLVASLVVVVIR
jgi:hypothetical protein